MKLVVKHEEFLTSSEPSCDAEGLSYGASYFFYACDVFSYGGCASILIKYVNLMKFNFFEIKEICPVHIREI